MTSIVDSQREVLLNPMGTNVWVGRIRFRRYLPLIISFSPDNTRKVSTVRP